MPELRRLTDFEQILLGLVASGSRSGYDLKRFFAKTPAVVYEPSSGALYPALRRLEKRKLVHSELNAPAGKREQRLYSLTATGREAHKRWLRQAVDPARVGRDLGIHLMRFVMAEREFTAEETLTFLRDLGSALDAFIGEMEAFLRDAPLTGRHPALAIQHGLAVHRASLRWVRDATASLMEDVGAANDIGCTA